MSKKKGWSHQGSTAASLQDLEAISCLLTSHCAQPHTAGQNPLSQTELKAMSHPFTVCVTGKLLNLNKHQFHHLSKRWRRALITQYLFCESHWTADVTEQTLSECWPLSTFLWEEKRSPRTLLLAGPFPESSNCTSMWQSVRKEKRSPSTDC